MTPQTETTPQDSTFVVQPRAVLYARVSDDDRRKGGRNLESQLEMGREYATKKEKGYSVIAELSEDDKGASGAEIDLPQLNKIREMAQAGQFDVLVVREIDRLSRNLAKQLVVEEELNRRGVRVEYVIGEYADTPEGRLNKHIRATIAEFEREKIRERMHRGKRLKVKSGNIMVAQKPPFGYKLVPNGNLWGLKVEEVEAKIIRQIFELFLDGLTIGGIRDRLNELGIPPPSIFRKFIRKSQSGRWSRTSVHNILTNKTYMGQWTYGKEKNMKIEGRNNVKKIKNNPCDLVLVAVDPIIDSKVFLHVQEKLSKNLGRRGRPNNSEVLLSKRVICGECGYKMRTHFFREGDTLKQVYYACPVLSRKDLNRPCSQKGFRQNEIDAVVWNWIESMIQDETHLKEMIKNEQANQYLTAQPLFNELKATQEQIKHFQKELNSLLGVLKNLKGGRGQAVILKDLENIEATLDKLEAHKAQLERKVEATTLTEVKVSNIKAIATKIAQGLEVSRTDFEVRKAIIDALDIEVRLVRENGEKIAYVTCYLGEHKIIMSNSVYTFLGESTKNGQRHKNIETLDVQQKLGIICLNEKVYLYWFEYFGADRRHGGDAALGEEF